MTDDTAPKPHIALAITMKWAREAAQPVNVAIEAMSAKRPEVTTTEGVAALLDTFLVPAFDEFRDRFAQSNQMVDSKIASGEWADDGAVHAFRDRVTAILSTRDKLAEIATQARQGALSLEKAWMSVYNILEDAFPGGG